jgi:small subunit ribosomal protein S21
LAEVTVGNEEGFDSLLKRFNRKVQQDGILAELRRREHYEKPSIKRKRKKAAKKRGAAKSTARVFRR